MIQLPLMLFGGVLGHGLRGIARFVLRRMLKDVLKDDDHPHPQLNLTVSHNIPEARKWLEKIQKNIRFATALALTRTAQEAQRALEREVDRIFDQPVNFTRKAFAIKMARRDNLVALVYIKPRQAAYLAPQIRGGHRRQKPFEQKLTSETGRSTFWVPGPGVRLTRSGNMTRAQVAGIAERLRNKGRAVFVGVPRGLPGMPFGIYERRAGQLSPLLVEIDMPRYARRFDFVGMVNREVHRVWSSEFSRAWREVMGARVPKFVVKLSIHPR